MASPNVLLSLALKISEEAGGAATSFEYRYAPSSAAIVGALSHSGEVAITVGDGAQLSMGPLVKGWFVLISSTRGIELQLSGGESIRLEPIVGESALALLSAEFTSLTVLHGGDEGSAVVRYCIIGTNEVGG